MSSSFVDFFRAATKGSEPYPYQVRFATLTETPPLLCIPTGAGKTATAVLGWLFRQQVRPRQTPRRLVYCLPMRVLVEQTERETRQWLKNLGMDVPVAVLLGGVGTSEWYLHPERPAILIGTQDMLLSRALNRGYAASRFHWPIDFAFLNNDCLWVYDEPQLMASGVSTSAQLSGLRRLLGTWNDCPSVWMSATLEPDWLQTIDFQAGCTGESLEPLKLTEEDFAPHQPLARRMTADKQLAALQVVSTKDMKDVAKGVLSVHQVGTQTLVVINTVDRATALYEELLKLRKKSATPVLLLVHARFRTPERRILNERLQQTGEDRIVIATQVVEAGVDISSRTVVTELAPWSSLVQRMGRCNRTGSDGAGGVYWIDLSEKLSAPYEGAELDQARALLWRLEGAGVSPSELEYFRQQQQIRLPFEHQHVLRQRDLLDLFDTSPDLSGNDIDIQRFVRGEDPELDVQVFWRELGNAAPSRDEPAPFRDELCNVPVGQLRQFLESRAEKRRGKGYVWDHLDERWEEVEPRQLRPGMTILLPAESGGYDWNQAEHAGTGWNPEVYSPVVTVPASNDLEEGAGSDKYSALAGPPLTITQHTADVVQELSALLDSLDVASDWREHLQQAALWHDLGKAHWAFQEGIRRANPSLGTGSLWAKSGNRGRLRHGRRYFRHELVSALAALQQDVPFAAVYLAGSHHGRVRLTIRALPDEDEPASSEVLFALGVHHGDTLPEVTINGSCSRELQLDLRPMLLGSERSWTANSLKLLAEQGPFRLAFFEALLRVADMRASRKEASHA